MGKGIEDLILPAAGIGALALSGGALSPALASMKGGMGLAGNALSAQGAAGLLGGAGATAAGDAAGLGATGLGAAALPEGMATFGPNNEFVGNTIMNDGMTANSFTGGFDALNPLERIGQRIGAMDLNGTGMKAAQQGLGMMQGGQQPQQQPMPAPITPVQAPPQQQGSFSDSNNHPSLAELEEMKKRQWLNGLGRANA